MTEAEWLTSTDPLALLRHVEPDFSASETLRLTVACVSRAPDLLTDEMRAWSDAALRVAEGRADPAILEELEGRAFESVMLYKHSPAGHAALDIYLGCWRADQPLYSEGVEGQAAIRDEKIFQADLVREHFGNPFRADSDVPGPGA